MPKFEPSAALKTKLRTLAAFAQAQANQQRQTRAVEMRDQRTTEPVDVLTKKPITK